MKRNTETVLLCITASAIAFLVGYGAFTWGFMTEAYKLAPEVEKTTVGTQNGW